MSPQTITRYEWRPVGLDAPDKYEYGEWENEPCARLALQSLRGFEGEDAYDDVWLERRTVTTTYSDPERVA